MKHFSSKLKKQICSIPVIKLFVDETEQFIQLLFIISSFYKKEFSRLVKEEQSEYLSSILSIFKQESGSEKWTV